MANRRRNLPTQRADAGRPGSPLQSIYAAHWTARQLPNCFEQQTGELFQVDLEQAGAHARNRSGKGPLRVDALYASTQARLGDVRSALLGEISTSGAQVSGGHTIWFRACYYAVRSG